MRLYFSLSLQWLSSLIQDHSQLKLKSSLTTFAGLPQCIGPDPHGLSFFSLCQLVTVAAAEEGDLVLLIRHVVMRGPRVSGLGITSFEARACLITKPTPDN